MRHILNDATVGEIWAIALENFGCGYVRILRGGCLGVVPIVSNGIIRDLTLFGHHQPKWYFDYAAPPNDRTKMFRVGVIPFADDEGWPPPRFIPPDVFKKHFQVYDHGVRGPATDAEVNGLQRFQMVTPNWIQQFILDHGNEFLRIEGAQSDGSKLKNRSEHRGTVPILLEIVFRKADWPFRERDAVEDRLSKAFRYSGVGEVTGGGIGPETCGIDVEVTDLPRALEIIRQTLRGLGCPESTEIHQHQPQHVLHRL